MADETPPTQVAANAPGPAPAPITKNPWYAPTITPKGDYDEGIFGLSVRGILTSMIIGTICAICLKAAFQEKPIVLDINLVAFGMLTLGFYFGKTSK